ncbi:MAG: hypothetical protein OEZ06_20355 [Myxococcales bacterium]|nr:hypothetical protein [Myxococcales bacterium]
MKRFDPQHGRSIPIALVLGVLALLLTYSCADSATRDGSQTHFLRSCDEGCEAPLSCLCGVCSLSCTADADCASQSSLALCLPPSEASSCEATQLCDVACSDDRDCEAVSAEHRCGQGRCRLPLAASAEPTRSQDPCADGGAWNADCGDGAVAMTTMLDSGPDAELDAGPDAELDAALSCSLGESSSEPCQSSPLDCGQESPQAPCLVDGGFGECACPPPEPCAAGFADCNADAADGCEANLNSDVAACGACGQSCGSGQACVDTVCVRVLATAATRRGSPVLDGGYLYVAECGSRDALGNHNLDGAVLRIAVADGAMEVLASGQHCPWSLALDASDAYFLNTGWQDAALARVPRAGGTVETLAEGLGSASELELSASYAFWLADGASTTKTITRFAKDGSGSVEALRVIQRGFEFEVAAETLYWPEDKSEPDFGIWSAGLDAVDPVRIVQSGFPVTQLLLAPDGIYWATNDSDTLSVEKAPLAGGTPQILAVDETANNTRALAVSGEDVYFLRSGDGVGILSHIPAQGGEVFLWRSSELWAAQIVVGDGVLYAVTHEGTVYALSLP